MMVETTELQFANPQPKLCQTTRGQAVTWRRSRNFYEFHSGRCHATDWPPTASSILSRLRTNSRQPNGSARNADRTHCQFGIRRQRL